MNETSRVEEFEKLVDAMAALLEGGHIFVSIRFEMPPGLSLVLEREAAKAEIERRGLSLDQFEEFLDEEVPNLMVALLTDSEEGYVESQLDSLKEEREGITDEQLEAERATRLAKLGAVSERIVDNAMRKRFTFKRRARSPVFVAFGWAVDVRHFDAKEQDELGLPYATCQIKYQKGIPALPFGILLGGPRLESVEIDCTLDEIEYMIRTLGEVREKLHSLQKEDQ